MSFHLNTCSIPGLPHAHGTGPDLSCFSIQLVRFPLIFLFVPCGGLGWLRVSFLLHVKYTLSYRIVSYRKETGVTAK